MDLLLIDDDYITHRIVDSFLHRFGKENGITVSLKSIFDSVQGIFELSKMAESFDVVALDVQMPKLTGNDIYDFLIQKKPHLLDNILFVTGYGEDLKERFPKQKLRVLDKPIRYEQFAKTLVSITG
jgi:CheY-like chemotaxis protein